jgi:hypothetical protein
VPVELLTDEEAARFGRCNGPPSLAELDRLFFLDDDDKSLQLVTVRYDEDVPTRANRDLTNLTVAN